MKSTRLVVAAVALSALTGCNPSGPGPTRALSASISVSHAPPPASTSAAAITERPKRAPGPVARASKEVQTALLTRLCQEKGLSKTATDAIVKVWFNGDPSSLPDDVASDAPFSLGDDHDLYVADVDNDGKDEWVITAQNTAGPHNSGIDKVFAERDGKLVELPFMDIVKRELLDGGADWHSNMGDPLLFVDKGVTYLNFRDVYALDAHNQVEGPTEEQARLVDVRYQYLSAPRALPGSRRPPTRRSSGTPRASSLIAAASAAF